LVVSATGLVLKYDEQHILQNCPLETLAARMPGNPIVVRGLMHGVVTGAKSVFHLMEIKSCACLTA